METHRAHPSPWIYGQRRHDAPIILAEYDRNWPVLFCREAERICSLLGETALAVEHIGSTSVPGLAAKPIIDVLLVVEDPSKEELYVAPLERAGYRLEIRELDWNQHRMLKGPDTDINLHVLPEGSHEITRHIAFRDWLRGHPEDRELYEKTKRQLAKRTWEHVQDYADAKTVIIESILAKALQP